MVLNNMTSSYFVVSIQVALRMISIDAWRSSIGNFNKGSSSALQRQTKCFGPILIFLAWAFVATIVSAGLINLLLIIGGVEQNPGPGPAGGKKGNLH